MADYVSKYTGSEVDGILDEAIELPQGTSSDDGKFLKYSSNSGLIWSQGNIADTLIITDGRLTESIHIPTVADMSGNPCYLKYNADGYLTWDYAVLPTLPQSGKYVLICDNGELSWEEQQ